MVVGRMTPRQYRAAVKSLGLSLNAAGPLLGVHPRTSHTWAALDGDGPPPTAAILLFMFQRFGIPDEISAGT